MKLARLFSMAGVGAALLAQAAPNVCADPPNGKGYKLVMDEEFNGTALNTNLWGYNYPWGHLHNGHAVMENYMVSVGGGILTLKAVAQQDPNVYNYNSTGGFWDNGAGKWVPYDYTAGTIFSNNRWHYGYFEGRFYMPWQVSTWPAWWFLQDGWPPELDVFEVHGQPYYSENFTYHYATSGGNASYGGAGQRPEHDAVAHLRRGMDSGAVGLLY